MDLHARDNTGIFSTTMSGLQTPTAAVVDQDLPLTIDAEVPVQVLDALNIEVTLTVNGSVDGRPLFVGIGSAAQVEDYLKGVTHEELVRVTGSYAHPAVPKERSQQHLEPQVPVSAGDQI